MNKPNRVKVTFNESDISELYHIVSNRGYCQTRTKLLKALRVLDAQTAARVDQQAERK
jgi:hypothetical protein